MVEHFILGLIQGITEWLPVSSEAMILLAQIHLFGTEEKVVDLVYYALYLHMGTFLAAAIYLRSDVWKLIKAIFQYQKADSEIRHTFWFLILATCVSAGLGIYFLSFLSEVELGAAAGKWVTVGIGCLLVITGAMQLSPPREGVKTGEDLRWSDGFMLGIAQGFSVLPGFSRSGLTVAVLLLKKFKKIDALRLSFLMSLPLLTAPLFLSHSSHIGWQRIAMTPEILVGIATAAVTGFLTIHLLMQWARRVNFGFFVIGFGLLSLVAVLL